MRAKRSSECDALLDFEEVRRRLQLGTRIDIGTREIKVAQVIGSVSRTHEFDGCFRPRTARLRKVVRDIRATRPDAANAAILVYQVDHVYFVVDGHKRLALAVDEGREYIDAEVALFPSRFHVSRGTTIDEIRATEMERHFRDITGLAAAVPEVRFALRNPDAFLELAESVKAHAYDLSRALGRLVEPAEAARHWYELVYQPAIEVARGAGIARVLESFSEPELFLVLRRGAHEPMAPGWRMPASVADRGVENLRAAAPRGVSAALARISGGDRSRPHILPGGDVEREATEGSGGTTETHPEGSAADLVGTVVRRPRRRLDTRRD